MGYDKLMVREPEMAVPQVLTQLGTFVPRR